MSTVFLGTSDFAAQILLRLAELPEHRPALVLTRPDRPRGRGRKLSSPPVAELARELALELEQPDSVNDVETVARIAAAEPAAVVVCAFGALIKEPLLSAHELLNVHPSLLPRWRGAAPIERAIMAGDADSGVCIMRLTAGLDSGPVCARGSRPIDERDTYGSLAAALTTLGGDLLVDVLDRKAHGRALEFVEQEDAGATYAEKIGAEDRLLDPACAAAELERAVRALSPHVGARVRLADETMLAVHEAKLSQRPDRFAGELGVVEDDGRMLLLCSAGALELLNVQPPGGRAMTAVDYLRGRGLPGRP